MSHIIGRLHVSGYDWLPSPFPSHRQRCLDV